MKIFKLFGVAVVAICMCVNFTACSSGDDADSGGFAGERKLVKMVLSDGDYTETYKFSYDNQGRVTEIKIGDEDYAWSRLFYWEDNSVRIMQDSGEHRGTCTIENGLVRSEYCSADYDPYTQYYHYNIADRYIGESGRYDSDIVWEGDKLISMVGLWDYNTTYTYGNVTCKKGYYPLFELTDFSYTNPELVGMKTNQLPVSSVLVWREEFHQEDTHNTYEYEFNAEGYLSKVIVKNDRGGTYSWILTWK